MEFTDLLQKRTSIRSYKAAPVTREQMTALLEAGTKAPNACNYQSWHFYAVCEKEVINAFHSEIARIPWIENIPLLIVVCIDEDVCRTLEERFGERGRLFAYQDSAGAANHILLRAADLGLGGCWVGPMNVEKCKKHLSIPEKHTPVAILTIGTPAAQLPKRERKPLGEAVTVIGALPSEGEAGKATCGEPEASRFSLAHASLPEAVFDDLNLSKASFTNINLQDASFRDINLQSASFEDINLSHACYGGLTMQEARFGCELGCVDLSGAVFQGVSFENAVLSDCRLDGMKIDGIDVKAAIDCMKNDSDTKES